MNDNIKSFDKTYLAHTKNDWIGCSFGGVALAAVGGVFSPAIGELLSDGDIFVFLYIILFETAGMLLYMLKFLYSRKEGQQGTIPVYNILRYTPCNRKNFIKSRMRRVVRFDSHLAVCAFLVKLLADIFFGNGLHAIEYLILLVLYIVLPLLCGLGMVLSACPKKKKMA